MEGCSARNKEMVLIMKWTRVGTGHYVCGEWAIKGVGTKWVLHHSDGSRLACNSKKKCQQTAEQAEDTPADAPDSAPEPVSEPLPPKPRMPSEKLSDSVLSSLSLQIDHLSHRIDALSAAIERLAAKL